MTGAGRTVWKQRAPYAMFPVNTAARLVRQQHGLDGEEAGPLGGRRPAGNSQLASYLPMQM